MSHTPGPWKNECFLVVAPSRPGGMYGGQEVCHTGGGRCEATEAEANARLIAAAPELLRALQPFVNLANDPELFKTLSQGLRAFEGMSLRAAVDEAARVAKKVRGE